ncbi:hypothetical protein H312_00994 [Anncaliia algerae PRA339]|uniref:ADF-H domain-containing protein n=1 Tax=Anncaliia algerae PRA339 TaxID=1288291 RepID=A0A059F3N3_9MICR|nr:hypothetical protein H312_00994 [Anncaliia algerae PRA339]
MSQGAAGFPQCKAITDQVRIRKKFYFIFTIDPVNPLTYVAMKIRENDIQKKARDIIDKEDAVKVFLEMKNQIKKEQGCFIVYDFPFYSEDRFLGNVLCLFSYIPENVSVLSKVAFSRASLDLPDQLGVAKHIQFHSVKDLDYSEIHKCISSLKRN